MPILLGVRRKRTWRRGRVNILSVGSRFGIPGAVEGREDFGVDLQESRFDRGGATQPPQERGEAGNELALDGRRRRLIGENMRFEGPVRRGVFEDVDNCLGRQSVPDGVLP